MPYMDGMGPWNSQFMDVIPADTWSIIGGSIVTRIFINHLGHLEGLPQPYPWGDLKLTMVII